MAAVGLVLRHIVDDDGFRCCRISLQIVVSIRSSLPSGLHAERNIVPDTLQATHPVLCDARGRRQRPCRVVRQITARIVGIAEIRPIAARSTPEIVRHKSPAEALEFLLIRGHGPHPVTVLADGHPSPV